MYSGYKIIRQKILFHLYFFKLLAGNKIYFLQIQKFSNKTK